MRKQSREVVFKMLFSYEYGTKDNNDEDIDVLLSNVLSDTGISVDDLDIDYVRDTYNAVISNMEDIKQRIYAKVPQYASTRIYNADLIILALAIHELDEAKLDSKIVISEAVKLAKKYSTEKSIKFINGILANISKEKNE